MGINKKIKVDELKRRKWPLPSYPIGQEVVDRKSMDSNVIYYDGMGTEVVAREGISYAHIPSPADYLQSSYVREGRIRTIPILEREGGKEIPPGECGITSLVKDSEGKILGATSGERVHLFECDPAREETTACAVDVGVIGEKSQTSSLAVFSNGQLFCGIKPESNEGHIYSCNYRDVHPRIEKVSCPVKGEGICALVIDNTSGHIYGLSSQTGTFFVFYPDSGQVELKGRVDEDCLFSEVLAIGPDGNVYGARRWGHFFKYNVTEDRITSMDIKAPSIRGREVYNKIDSLVADESSRSIYGGTSADGILFRLALDEERVVSLGKPLDQPRIRCLTLGKDACIYGIAGKNCCHLFTYNAQDGELADLGIPFVSAPRHWHGYEFDAAVTGDDGRIYLGQNERISYLFVYSPVDACNENSDSE